MAGSFERQIYDVGAYHQYLKQSTNPLLYRLDPVYNNRCDPCRIPQPGYIGRVGVSVTHKRPLVDVESDLFQIGTKNTKDPNARFQPTCVQCGSDLDGYPAGSGVAATCDKCHEELFHLPVCESPMTDSTRISNPVCTARGVGINRFQPLCLNPQDENRWFHPSEVGISYRMVVKDNHVPCIPKLLDPAPALPKRSPERVSGAPGKPVSNPVVYPGQIPVGVPLPETNCNYGVHREPMHKHGKANRNWNNTKFV